jgi:hypothetical protein
VEIPPHPDPLPASGERERTVRAPGGGQSEKVPAMKDGGYQWI